MNCFIKKSFLQVNVVPSISCDNIKYDDSPQLPLMLETLNIIRGKWQFFVYNNNSDFGRQAGSHWSLLVYNPKEQEFYHIDSMSGYVPELMQNVIKNVLCKFLFVFFRWQQKL